MKFNWEQWCSQAFPGGRAANPEDQIEEENEEKLRKRGENNRRMRKNEEIFLVCPPEVKSLSTPPVREALMTVNHYTIIRTFVTFHTIAKTKHS